MSTPYLPINEPLVHEPTCACGGKVKVLAALLIGFGLGCAAIYGGVGQPLAALYPTDTIALQYMPAQASLGMMPMGTAMPKLRQVMVGSSGKKKEAFRPNRVG